MTSIPNPKPSGSKKKKLSENARKGTLVEAIVAMLHDIPGVKVERNAKLSPLHGDQTRTRDIDVLLTSDVAGYPVRIAISCKNEQAKIKLGAIGEFIDQLNEVGIPPQQGIFVCVNGFTRDALDRAKTVGIRTLVLRGLTKNRLASEVAQAFQFQVSLLAEVRSATITNTVAVQEFAGQFFLFFDEQNRPCGTLLDLILAWWQQRDTSVALGVHELNLEVPEGWHQYVDNQPARVLAISALVHVRGLIVTVAGKEKRHSLINTNEHKFERTRIRVDFDIPNKKRIKFPLEVVNTEDELSKFTHRPGNTRIVIRIKLPRILYHPFYFPFSDRVFRLIHERCQKFNAGEIADPRAFSLEETEGSDLSAMWEPPWYEGKDGDRGPVIVPDEEGKLVDVRLLMKREEYKRIVALDQVFRRNPLPEFAHYMYWANIALGSQIASNATTRDTAQTQRLLNLAKDKFERATKIISDKADAYIHLGGVLHRLEQHALALASYDKALRLEPDRYDAWTGRAVTLLRLERFEDGLASVTKSIEVAAEPDLRVIPLLMRSYAYLHMGRNSESSKDLIESWKVSAGQLLEDVKHHELIEAICMRSTDSEAILILSELYWRQAGNEAANNRTKEARQKADNAVENLYKIKATHEADETLVLETMSGQLIYDFLTRSAGYLVKEAEKDLALDNIEKMQSWATKVCGEPFDSLTKFISELSLDQ